MAKVFLKPPENEKCVILAVREAFTQPFEATNWLDLRVGFFLSICGDVDGTDDNTITGLSEDIGADDTVGLQWSDRVAIGLTDSTLNSVFLGYTNAGDTQSVLPTFPGPQFGLGRSRLLSSDGAIGTTNTDYWRPTNGLGNDNTVKIFQNNFPLASSVLGSQPHFVQNYAGGHAAGYSTLLALRFTRPDVTGRQRIITMEVKKAASGDSGDLLFSSTPTTALIESSLQSWTTTVQTLGPVEIGTLPDSLYLNWPFRQSRLRIHSIGILKAA